ncbi:GAF domain-containing sensor histidine kinase [Marinigracilibium pacificum]|uniref:histidine kinase n=1 Tax=Marinigracilibium pacificum TaxID=2729599 RepID=A0A848J4V2_9BACT|nr:GAF domain-containing sensor histidine kinase [Marinigracilibium pacificum]NMM48192.1 GAF domain-containing sensor histidine kinase [Marinigracilibium pacificum]
MNNNYPIPENEAERLNFLKELDILDTKEEEQYNRIVELASQICKVPISLITLVDQDRQWFKANKGLTVSSTSREAAFCSHTIIQNEILIVNDALADDRFKNNPLVLGYPNIRFYAGWPLITTNGLALGSLCVIDNIPRELTDEQEFALKVLSEQVLLLFDNRLKQKQLDQKIHDLDIQNKKLTELNQMGNQFISLISHDLKSPLSTTKSLIYLLKNNSIAEEDLDKYLDQMDVMIDGTNHLIENLVSWGSKQLEGRTIESQLFSPIELIESSLEIFKINLTAKNIQLKNSVPSDLSINSDKDILYFVFRNMIHNAIKFTDNGEINITYEATEDYHEFIVKDSGIGMDNETVDKLNSGKISNSNRGTKGEKGSGLGSYFCKKFLEKLSGRIIFESVKGYGTSVKILLPKN